MTLSQKTMPPSPPKKKKNKQENTGTVLNIQPILTPSS